MSGKEKNQEEVETHANKNKRNRRDKPWDNDTIDHWKVEEFKEEHSSGPLTEESSFATLFPKYREKYLREVWPHVTAALDKHGVGCELNLVEGSMTVKTTRKTVDPYIIIKSRDLIKLLSRSVPLPQAVKILDDNVVCDIIKIGNIVRNKERFVKRRQRLIGPNGNTLKALELLTKCFMMVQGNTVAVMGSFQGVKKLRTIVLDCMENIHPIYHIKELMIRRELAKDEKLKEESWDRFLPKFHKKNVKSNKKSKKKEKKKAYDPFPPQQTLRKEDIQMETGEYFLKQSVRELKESERKKQQQLEKSTEKQSKRGENFIAPDESSNTGEAKQEDAELDLDALKKKIQKKAQREGDSLTKTKKPKIDQIDDYISK